MMHGTSLTHWQPTNQPTNQPQITEMCNRLPQITWQPSSVFFFHTLIGRQKPKGPFPRVTVVAGKSVEFFANNGRDNISITCNLIDNTSVRISQRSNRIGGNSSQEHRWDAVRDRTAIFWFQQSPLSKKKRHLHHKHHPSSSIVFVFLLCL